MSGALTIPLADAGPVHLMGRELQARVQAIFPPAYFGFAWMPAKANRAWFKRYMLRLPAVAIGWNGITSDQSGRRFSGTVHFTLALIQKNQGSVDSRYFGDALGPGLFAMTRAATVLLQGYVIDPPETPWAAQGGVQLSRIENLYDDEWGDEDTAISALELIVPYEETLPPGMEQDAAAPPLNFSVNWNFGQQYDLTQNVGPNT